MSASPARHTLVSALKPEQGRKLLGTFKNGMRLLALTVILHVLSSLYNGLFWMLPPLFYLGIGWALVYCGLCLWFGYRTTWASGTDCSAASWEPLPGSCW